MKFKFILNFMYDNVCMLFINYLKIRNFKSLLNIIKEEVKIILDNY